MLIAKEQDKARSHLLLAKVYEQLENKTNAAKHYKMALKSDYTVQEAFDVLVKHRLLADCDLNIFVNEINFQMEDAWLKDYYLSVLNK